jgi:HNH endonuclease
MCSGCGLHRLTPEWNSVAHIFPNALGGRLAPGGLICRECNTLLNVLADNPLIQAFGPWRGSITNFILKSFSCQLAAALFPAR